jgi:hypothetical protein
MAMPFLVRQLGSASKSARPSCAQKRQLMELFVEAAEKSIDLEMADLKSFEAGRRHFDE